MTGCRRKSGNGFPKNFASELPEHKRDVWHLAHGRGVADLHDGVCLDWRARPVISRGASESSRGMPRTRAGDSFSFSFSSTHSCTHQLSVLRERSPRSHSECGVFSAIHGCATLQSCVSDTPHVNIVSCFHSAVHVVLGSSPPGAAPLRI